MLEPPKPKLTVLEIVNHTFLGLSITLSLIFAITIFNEEGNKYDLIQKILGVGFTFILCSSILYALFIIP